MQPAPQKSVFVKVKWHAFVHHVALYVYELTYTCSTTNLRIIRFLYNKTGEYNNQLTLLVMLISAPCSHNTLTVSTPPHRAASCNGVFPSYKTRTILIT